MRDILFKLKILCWGLRESFDAWRDWVWNKDLDSHHCCDGRECACGGATIRDLYTPVKPAGTEASGTPAP